MQCEYLLVTPPSGSYAVVAFSFPRSVIILVLAKEVDANICRLGFCNRIGFSLAKDYVL